MYVADYFTPNFAISFTPTCNLVPKIAKNKSEWLYFGASAKKQINNLLVSNSIWHEN